MNCGFNWITVSLQQQQSTDIQTITCFTTEPKVKLNYPCGQTKTSCYPYVLNLIGGKYKFELEGGSGGNPATGLGGKGGYVSGNIFIRKPLQHFFLHIGASGITAVGTIANAVYNGGGIGWGYLSEHHISSGGGGTDIRLNESINSRIIVAGGGGGGG